jgi:general secretion pathway protein K
MKEMMKNETGIALFLVLWVLTLLSVIAGEFCFAMRTEVNITRNFKEQTEAYYIALAGMNRAIGELIRNEVMPPKTTSVELPGKEETPEEEEDKDRWRINVEIPAEPYGEGEYEVRIGNESGKININVANEALLKMMLEGFDLEEQEKNIIVDSILDWRDKNTLHRLNGAEDDYYRSLPEPYECKDDDFDSVEELLLVRGVTPEIFYGGLKDIVTAFKPDQKGSSVGEALSLVKWDARKININAAPRQVLLALPSMTEDLVQQIVDYRKSADFTSLTQVSSMVGTDVYALISPYITLETSPYFTIRSVGKTMERRIRQGVEAMVEINKKSKRGYRMVQWRDGFQDEEAEASDSKKSDD